MARSLAEAIGATRAPRLLGRFLLRDRQRASDQLAVVAAAREQRVEPLLANARLERGIAPRGGHDELARARELVDRAVALLDADARRLHVGVAHALAPQLLLQPPPARRPPPPAPGEKRAR